MLPYATWAILEATAVWRSQPGRAPTCPRDSSVETACGYVVIADRPRRSFAPSSGPAGHLLPRGEGGRPRAGSVVRPLIRPCGPPSPPGGEGRVAASRVDCSPPHPALRATFSPWGEGARRTRAGSRGRPLIRPCGPPSPPGEKGSEKRLDPIRLCLLDEPVHPHGRRGHSAHRDLERRDAERVFQFDLIGDARQPGAESQVAGEGFGAMPKSTFESCSQRSSLAGSPGSSTISSA